MVEAAHTNVLGPRGMEQKTSDFSAVPLCAAHHRENPDSYHTMGEKGFSHEHGIDLETTRSDIAASVPAARLVRFPCGIRWRWGESIRLQSGNNLRVAVE